MKTRFLSFLLTILCVFPVTSFAALEIKIISVHDGDTLTGIGVQDKAKYKVRLMGVDTPEVDFFNNSQGESAFLAREALLQMIPEGSVVTVSDDSQTDKHGRILGRLFKDRLEINKEMLRGGWGFIYFIFPFDKRLVSDYSQAAQEAFEHKRGLFASLSLTPQAPYLFRMSVQNQIGRNLIGDFRTKELVAPENIEMIPFWRRVFFSDQESAQRSGYNLIP